MSLSISQESPPPIILKLDEKFQPCPVDEGDEVYPNGIFQFNISRLLAFLDDRMMMLVSTMLLAVDQRRELAQRPAAYASCLSGHSLKATLTPLVHQRCAARPPQLATDSCPDGDALHWCYATTASTTEYCEAV
jgi:hypothetical protein